MLVAQRSVNLEDVQEEQAWTCPTSAREVFRQSVKIQVVLNVTGYMLSSSGNCHGC